MITKANTWEYKKISDTMIQVIDGDRGKEYPKEAEFKTAGYCLFLTAYNITKHGFRLENSVFVSQVRDNKLGKGRLILNDIILTTRGSVGNIALYNDAIPFLNIRINSGMVILRANPHEILPSYLEILFTSGYVTKQITKLVYGSAQPQLTVKAINCIILPIPDLKTQAYLTTVVKSCMNVVEKTDKLIVMKKTFRKALMNRLLTGMLRFPGFGKPVSKAGDLPEGWRRAYLGDVCSIKYGASWNAVKAEVGYPVYGTGGLMGHASKYISKTPSIIIGRKGTIDRPFYLDEPFWAVDTTFYAQSISSDNLKFVYFQLLTQNWSKYNEASGIPSLNRNTISKIPIMLPHTDEQLLVGKILGLLDEQIKSLYRFKRQYNNQKDGLMNLFFK